MASPVARHLKNILRPGVSPIKLIELHKTPTSVKKEACLKMTIRQRTRPNCAKKLFNSELVSNISKSLNCQGDAKVKYILPVIKVNNKVIPSVDTPERNSSRFSALDGKNYNILGKGSFGVVIEAEYKGLRVATKLIKKQDKEKEVTLMNECNAYKLKHPNIVQVIKVVCEPNSTGMVIMELHPARNLQNIIDEAVPLNSMDKKRIILDISLAIEYCHSLGILHLDIKPKNFLVNEGSKQCKLCDFGNSWRVTRNENSPKNWNYQGTVKYTPPELLKGEVPTYKADIYSLGISMWQIIYEETPYGGINNDVIVYQVVVNNIRPHLEHGKEHKHLKELCERCWDTNPTARPGISEVVHKMKSMLEQHS